MRKSAGCQTRSVFIIAFGLINRGPYQNKIDPKRENKESSISMAWENMQLNAE